LELFSLSEFSEKLMAFQSKVAAGFLLVLMYKIEADFKTVEGGKERLKVGFKYLKTRERKYIKSILMQF
jgi:hypothetical protein